MAIGYTELDFVDGQAPAISAANLNHIDEGVKACADQLDAETTPGRALVEAADVAAQRTALGLGTAALASDASESAKGIVQLGATGVPSATKVPKALGADLVALITAAGYTLSPAEGTATLDGIADGTTYKRVLAAIATALNASTIVAGTQWGSGNDGNGGQPPAPKPNTTSGAIGQVVLANSTPGNAYSLPAGGVWFYSSYLFNDTTSIYNGFLSGLATGGTEILPASAGNIWRGFAWRIE